MAADARAVRFRDDSERILFAKAMTGEKVRIFLNTDPVGQFLHAKAKEMIEIAREEALDVDPDGWRGWFQSRRKLRQIRQRAAVAHAFIDWMGEAIMEGDNAGRELDERYNRQ